MLPDEIEQLCDALTDLAGTGPSRDPRALVQAQAILRKITGSAEATPYVLDCATQVDRALSGWFDSEERFRPLLKGYSADIYTLIDRLHSAAREASRFRAR